MTFAEVSSLEKTLRQALGDRAFACHLQILSGSRLRLGICCTSSMGRLIEHGPEPEQEDAPAFRAFWGSKCELRRFRDGRITESVIWSAHSRVESQLVTHIVQKKYPHSSVTDHTASYREILQRRAPVQSDFRTLFTDYEQLNRFLLSDLRDQLPLDIINVYPISPALRYTETFPPKSSASGMGTSEVLIEFESSGRWPDDLEVIQSMKLAFLRALADKVAELMPGASAQIAFDEDFQMAGREITDHVSLEVSMPSGYTYSLRVLHTRESLLLQRILGDAKGLHDRRTLTDARAALSRFEQRFVASRTHHAFIKALHHTFPSFSSGVRLIRRWIDAQLLSDAVPVEALELLTAELYTSPSPWSAPQSAECALTRFLTRMAEWKFSAWPRFIPVEKAEDKNTYTFDVGRREEGSKLFDRLRSQNPSLTRGPWVLVTENDASGTRWTAEQPSRMIAGRIRALAKASLKLFDQESEATFDPLVCLSCHPR